VETHSVIHELCAGRQSYGFVESNGRTVAAYGCKSTGKEFILSALLTRLPSFLFCISIQIVLVPSIGEECPADCSAN